MLRSLNPGGSFKTQVLVRFLLALWGGKPLGFYKLEENVAINLNTYLQESLTLSPVPCLQADTSTMLDGSSQI